MRTRKIRFFCLLTMFTMLVASLGGCATTARDNPDSEFTRGLSELQVGRTDAGFNRIKACAQGGHTGCMQILGGLFLSGQGTAPDPREALRWQKYASNTGLDGGFASVLGAINVARYYCDHVEVGGTYADVALWTDRAERLHGRLLTENRLRYSSYDIAIRNDVGDLLQQLFKSIETRTCAAASG